MLMTYEPATLGSGLATRDSSMSANAMEALIDLRDDGAAAPRNGQGRGRYGISALSAECECVKAVGSAPVARRDQGQLSAVGTVDRHYLDAPSCRERGETDALDSTIRRVRLRPAGRRVWREQPTARLGDPAWAWAVTARTPPPRRERPRQGARWRPRSPAKSRCGSVPA